MPNIAQLLRQNVREARKQAAEILADRNTVVLDTETTGLHNAYICDIAIIGRGTSGHQVLLNTLLNPKVRIPDDAARIHGITNKAVVSAPTFADIWPTLEPILRNRRVVAYNAPFDLRVLSNEIDRFDPKLEVPVHSNCAMRIYQQWYYGGTQTSGKHKTRLVDPHCTRPACQQMALDHAANAHRAYADTLTTVKRLQLVANTCWLHDHD
jgi:DNA polymerase-3 subunit epsilon